MMQPSSRFTHPVTIAVAAGIAVALFVALVLATASIAAAAHAPSGDRPHARATAFAAGAKPHARAKLTTCVSAPAYNDRQIVFTGRMYAFTDTPPTGAGTLQMRFDVYRRLNGQARFKLQRAAGLSQWIGNTEPTATVYVRNVALSQVETAARYKARVRFRWLDGNGKTQWHKTRETSVCKQKAPLPDLIVSDVQRYPGTAAGASYVVGVTNKNASEARNVQVSLQVDGNAAVALTIDSVPSLGSVELSFDGQPACQQRFSVEIDPQLRLRESDHKNDGFAQTC